MALGDFLFPNAELTLVITHSFEADVEAARNMSSQDYLDRAARIRLNKGDIKRLGLKEGGIVGVKSKTGNVIVRAFSDDKITEGMSLMPHGPWALALVQVPEDNSPIKLHGIPITVVRSEKEITSLESLFD
jgi:formylmethanofuran dehydrogenase subunit D